MCNKLHKYYEEHTASFFKNFSKTHKRFGVEDIHQLRVDIKKLRAILQFLEFISKGEFNTNEHFNLFSTLFKDAGKVRTMQVNLFLINEIDQNIISTFKEYMHLRQLKAIPKLNRKLSYFDSFELNELNNSLLVYVKNFSDNEIQEKSEIYISDKTEKIQKLRLKPDDKKLHKIRFHTKEMKEIFRIINAIQPEDECLQFENNLKRFNEIIGNWHDNVVLINSMVKFNRKAQESAQSEQLTELIEYLEQKNSDTKAKVIDNLNNIIPIS